MGLGFGFGLRLGFGLGLGLGLGLWFGLGFGLRSRCSRLRHAAVEGLDEVLRDMGRYGEV